MNPIVTNINAIETNTSAFNFVEQVPQKHDEEEDFVHEHEQDEEL